VARGSHPAKRALARNVLRLRREKDFSQHELAARARVTQALVSAIELEDANPTVESVARLARALGVTVADLFAEAPPRA
jgi:transcriptional regulator with XRE-family HTH domain